jgi:hypothetical protein
VQPIIVTTSIGPKLGQIWKLCLKYEVEFLNKTFFALGDLKRKVSNVGSLLRIDGILPSTSWESNLKQQLKK